MDIVKELRKYFDTNTWTKGGTRKTSKDYFKHLESKIKQMYKATINFYDKEHEICQACSMDLIEKLEDIIKTKN